jgi:hypothetical protein
MNLRERMHGTDDAGAGGSPSSAGSGTLAELRRSAQELSSAGDRAVDKCLSRTESRQVHKITQDGGE